MEGKIYIECILDGGKTFDDVVEQLYAHEVPVKDDIVECMSGKRYIVVRREWVELGEDKVYKTIYPILYVKAIN